MKFEDWDEEKDLHKVCEKLLDNADLDYSITTTPLEVELVFYVAGSDIKVVFNCSDIRKIEIEKEPDDVPIHLVLEVVVTESDIGTQIQIYPEININLICEKFSWHLDQVSSSERNKIYGNA